MADSPGKVLSSFASSHERNGSGSKLGGCAGVFFQLLDRFNGKKLFPYKLLPSERPKHNTISHTEEKLPMGKLLLIADENRIGSSRRDGESFSDGVFQRNENCEEKQGKKSVGVVARLMGLETMPSPEPSIRERKSLEVFRDKKEAQSTKRLLQSKQILIEKAQKSTRAMDTRFQALRRRTRAPHPGQIYRFEAKIAGLNSVADALKQSSTKTRIKSHKKSSSFETRIGAKSRKTEDSNALFFSKLPSISPIQVESPLRSILSPSRTSCKLLPPIKSPLSSKSTARLFGAAARVLEPSLRPARNLGFHSHNSKPPPHDCGGEDTNEKKKDMLGASTVASLEVAQSMNPVVNHGLELERETPLSTPTGLPDCKGQARSRCSKSAHEGKAQLSINDVNPGKPFISKQEEAKTLSRVKNGKKSNYNLPSKKKSVTPASHRQEKAGPVSGGDKLRAWSNSKGAPTKNAQLDRKQDNTLLPVLVKDEAIGKLKQPSRSEARTIRDSSISTTTGPSRTVKSLQGLKSSSQGSSEAMNREGSRSKANTSSPNAGKATNLSKINSVGAQRKSLGPAQMKGGSSCIIKTSSKRKASNLSPKPAVSVVVLTPEEKDVKHYDAKNVGMMQRFGANSLGVCDEESNYYQRDYGTSVLYSLDDINAASRSEAESVQRVRARWDISDDKKKTITINCISCREDHCTLINSHSASSSTRKEDTFKTSGIAAGVPEDLLLCLNTTTSEPLSGPADDCGDLLFHKDGSEALYNHSLRSCSDLTGLSTDLSTVSSSFFGLAEQRPSSFEGFSPREDTSIRDCESVADSLCTEECGQPSPVSILESPFLDSASSSSDSFEAQQGSKQWETNALEHFDCMSAMGKQVKIYDDTQTMAESQKFMDVMCRVHCMDPAVLDVNAKNNTAIDDEDSYLKAILGATLSSAKNSIWESLAFSGPLINPAFFYQLEEQHDYLPWKAAITPESYTENDYDYDVSTYRTNVHVSFTSRCKEASLQKRKLLFDCIEEALRLSLDLARQSYGISVAYMQQLTTAHVQKSVFKQINDWKGLAMSMNLDDMMKMEISEGMGRWFKFGTEKEKVTESIETMILMSLMDELMKEMAIKVSASCVYSYT